MKTKILADFQICISVPLKIIKSNFLRFALMKFIWNHFNEIFISHLEHFNVSGNACPQHCIILRKITNIVFSTKKKISFKNLLSSNETNIGPCSKNLILPCQSIHYVKHRNFVERHSFRKILTGSPENLICQVCLRITAELKQSLLLWMRFLKSNQETT